MTSLHGCIITDEPHLTIIDDLIEDLAEQISMTVLSINESPRNVKTQILAMESVQLILVVSNNLPKSMTSLLQMLKQKKQFACAYIGQTELDGSRIFDWQESFSAIPDLLSSKGMLMFLADSARHRQKEVLMHEAKIHLLTQLTQLTRSEITIDHCVGMLKDSLTMLCQAPYVSIYHEGMSCEMFANDSSCAVMRADAQSTIPDVVQQAITEQKVKVSFDETTSDIVEIRCFDSTIAGSLTFPIICNGKVMSIIQCYLSQDMLDTITLETISLIEQACHQLNIILERLEAQHTLVIQHNELAKTLKELQTTKAQLYQTEKLAAIGQLAAGIAHEINNPLAFVASNFQSLMKYVDTMAEVLNEHRNFLHTIKSVTEQKIDFSVIEDKQRQSNLAFILEDVDDLVADSKDGLDRIREIIDNLLSFSRKDDNELQAYDIHAGVTSTLKILNAKLKKGVEVETDFRSERTVMCQPGLINQVLLNIVQNAVDAMDGQGKIMISTYDTDDDFIISVRDSGPGIPDGVVRQIFDPFFTTKEVQKGTGLGLSISHGIIEQHQGRITVNTELGVFTEFMITLPAKELVAG